MTRSSPPQTPHFDVSSIFSARLSTRSQFTFGIHSLTLATIMEREWRELALHMSRHRLCKIWLCLHSSVLYLLSPCHTLLDPSSCPHSASQWHIIVSLGATLCQLRDGGIMTPFYHNTDLCGSSTNNVGLWNKSHFQSFCVGCKKSVPFIGGFYWSLGFCAGSRFWGQQEKSPLLIFNGGPRSIGFFIVPPNYL